jgi:serine/threonine protein kinase
MSSDSSQDSRRYLRIGKYEVLAHIATGGMGAVYKALDADLGREVALKILSTELAVKPDLRERFRNEARAAARLRHKNIVSIYGFEEDNGTYFLVMEYVDGIDLLEHIRKNGTFAPREACRILIQAARALDHLHQLGMVHRDIKPANFLIARHHNKITVKLTDLGLAREVDDNEFKVTREGTTVGTIDYMSPEQARNSRLADMRSDIYSLGCTLFHMLAGNPPFAEGGLTERLYKHLEEEPPDIRQINPAVPENLAAVMRRMLAKKPDDRYQTPTELLHALLRVYKRRRKTSPPDPAPISLPEPRMQAPPAAPPVPTLEAEARARQEELRPKTPPPLDEKRAKDPAASTENILAVDHESTLLPTPNLEQKRAAAGQFDRAKEVIANRNFDYAIHLLITCCRLDPANLPYRKLLRNTVKAKFSNRRRAAWLSWLMTLRARTRLKAAKRAANHLQVLEHGEVVLASNPWDLSAQMDMAEAAEALGLINLAIWILEQACEGADNIKLNRVLAILYEKRRDYPRAIHLWERVRKADPFDLEAAQKLTDLAARDTIARIHSRK